MSPAFSMLCCPALEFSVNVTHAASVDHAVRCIHYAPLVKRPAVPRFSQLIVGRSGDDVDLQGIERITVDHSAQGTKREDIGVDPVHDIGPHSRGTEVRYCPPDSLVLDIGDAQSGPLRSEVLAKMIPHMSQPLNDDVTALERFVAVAESNARLDALIDAEGGNR